MDAASVTSRHVLVAEDEDDIRELVADLLVGAGFRVSCACDGVDALARARAERPAVIILDRRMPGLRGEEVIRELRRDPALAKIPVIAMSALRRPPPLDGATLLLRKPFDPDALLELVARALDDAENADRGARPSASVV